LALVVREGTLTFHVEIIVPRQLLHGTGAEGRHIQTVAAEDIDGLRQRACLVTNGKQEEEAVLGILPIGKRSSRRAGKDAEAGGITAALVDMALQNGQTEEGGALLAADGGKGRIACLSHVLGGDGGIFKLDLLEAAFRM